MDCSAIGVSKMQAVVPTPVFRASPVIDFQVFLSSEKPEGPPGFRLEAVAGTWIATDERLRRTRLLDSAGREFAIGYGFIYSEFTKDFVLGADETCPEVVESIADFESKIIPRLAGSFVLLTTGGLPPRLYLDHAGSMPIVYSPADRRAATSASLLLDEAEYRSRFLTDLHDAMIVREGEGSWISGTLTAHRDVYRLLANHHLDLATWNVARFWPRPGEFEGWRNFDVAAAAAADAIKAFSDAVFRNFRTAATLTAGFDTRLVLAGCRDNIANCQFYTIAAPHAEKDTDIAKRIGGRFGLKHKILALRRADPMQTAIWDRTVGDSIIEAPRLTYPTLQRDLTDFDVQLTGAFGEIGRCRYYRQDLHEINDIKIDARFVVDRLTLPPQPELIVNIQNWIDGLEGQPNSVILDLALHELKLGSWAMPQRAFMSSVKLSMMPFAQRVVFDSCVGVSPLEKNTKTLFWAMIVRLWPDLKEFQINKYGDYKDQLMIFKKIFAPNRIQRLLRDRSAKKVDA